ncbi:MAG TPA: hypothetical protein GXZ48_03335 [Acholeplasmataceae bacterium]|nr:hypothetical protein [Acholeplasmataceae bacterium]
MIYKIQYNIRFPADHTFNKPIQYLLVSGFYKSIKDKLCLNENKECKSCNHVKKCIYYFVSGENFNKYPGILIQKNYYEKKHFKANESTIIKFYLIGNTEIYKNLVIDYMLYLDYIGGIFIQKSKLANEKLNTKSNFSGKIIFKSPFKNVQEIHDMILYYNETYKTRINPNFIIKPLNTRKLIDETKYIINNHFFRISGHAGIYEVIDYPLSLIEIGVGKENIIGGGHAICVLE